MMKHLWIGLSSIIWACSTSPLWAEAEAEPDQYVPKNAGFLEDYALLKPGPGSTLCYKSADFAKRIVTYDAVMVDQPEIILSAQSSYRGLKTRQLDIMTTTFRQAVQDALAKDYRITDTPGPKVMLIRLAAVNMMLKKERFHILEYTPQGLIIGAGKYIFEPQLNRAMRHIDLKNVSIEGEVRDAQSGEVLAAFAGATKKARHPETWHHLVVTLKDWSEQLDASLQRLRADGAQTVPCR